MSRRFSAEQAEESLRLVGRFIGERPPLMRAQATAFLLLVDALALGRFLRPFRALDRRRQERLLRRLFDSPVPLLRKGFWGLNTLAKLGVYGQPSTYVAIGYQPSSATPVAPAPSLAPASSSEAAPSLTPTRPGAP
jgi:hypothetical protein